MYRFFVAGDDARAEAIRNALIKDGYELCDIKIADAVILPPVLKLETACKAKVFAAYDHTGYINYAKCEDFKNKNGVLTAEGAIATAVFAAKLAFCDMSCAIIGDGAIAKALKSKLDVFAKSVTTYSRRSGNLDKLSGCCHDVIFNTVPAQVISASVIERFAEKPLIIDLASMPGGVDKEAAERFGITVLHELSVPGRISPQSAGVIIKDTVISLLRGVK